MKPGHAIIVGGGIGGVAAAIALALRGWTVQVLEQASHFQEVGAGVQIGPNGVKVLNALGASDALEAFVFEPGHIEMRDAHSGRQIFRLPMKGYAETRWGARYLQVHRADLHLALSTRLQQVAGDAVRLGHRVKEFAQTGEVVEVRLADGETLSADLLVGADGIHSAVRNQIFGPDDLSFTGNVAWRAVVPTLALGDRRPPAAGCVWASPGRHAVTTLMRGGALTNFVGIVEEDTWREDGWNIPGDRRDALALFGDWDPTLRAILEQSEHLHRWALFARAPLQTWVQGSAALLGDAAHPMLPSMAQGAVQALEDAWALGACLYAADGVPSALQQYVRRRQRRATAVQARSARNLAMFHAKGFKRHAMHKSLWLAGQVWPGFLHQQQNWIYGWDETA